VLIFTSVITTKTIEIMTTIETLSAQFENEKLRETFKRVYKNTVNRIVESGIDFDHANRMAFDFLIKEGGFEKVLSNAIK
jgi:tagatose-1,6-bisphosphate aldolase non-catalytic subunit AgaZ/GatZ